MFNVSQTHSNLWKMRLILLLLHVWGNLHVSLSQNELKCLVPEIENGYITEEASEYRENEILYFRCNRTFKRREDRPSKCTKIGMRAEWSPTPECEPTKCVLQLPPLEGTTYEPAFKSVFVPGETLRVTCEGRFWIFSSRETVAETTCNDDGQWTINPVCKEVVCTNEREYNVRRWDVWWGQRIVMGDTVEYSCIADYESSDGSNLAKCTREGWKPKPLCQEIICHRMDIENAVNRDPYSLTYKNNKRVYYECREGFTGSPFRTCTANGWTGDSMCTEITCNRKYYSYAVIEGTDKSVYKYNEQVDYVCNNGYVGRFTLTCGKGRWKGTQSCMRKPCNRPELMDANIRGAVKQSYSNNEKIQYVCTYSQEVHEAKCEEGVWTGITNCSELKCLVPEIENGYITEEASEYRENEILYFRCNRTFKRREDRPSKCTKVGMRAEWSPTPECEPTKCVLQLPPLEGTTYEPAFKSVFVPGETLRVTCEGRFWIFSSRETVAETTCDDDGQWTINPVCKEVVCTNEREYNVRRWDVWWGQRIVMGDTVEYSCIADYESSDGSNLAKCTREGWKPKPLCQEIICHRMDIENAVNRDPYSLTYKNNKRVYYECREGFTGSPFRTCTANGWTGDSMCTEITCNRKYYSYAVIEGTDKSVYKYNEQVDYVCNNGYVGRFTLTCGKGRWKGTQSCMRKPCNRPELMDANIRGAVKQSYSNNEKIQYVCTYSQEVHEAKCEEGVWTGITNCSGLKTRHDAADSR